MVRGDSESDAELSIFVCDQMTMSKAEVHRTESRAQTSFFIVIVYIKPKSPDELQMTARTYISVHMPREAKSVVLSRPGTVPGAGWRSFIDIYRFILYCRARSKRRLSSRFTHFVSRHFENEKGCRGIYIVQ